MASINIKTDAGGAENAFTVIQTDAGTNPMAESTTDTLTLTSSDGSILITGDSGTDTVDFTFVPGNTVTTIFNVSAPTAGVEVSQALPANSTGFVMQVRNDNESTAKLQFSFVITESGTKFATVHPGSSYSDEKSRVAETVFFQTNKASQTVEIIAFS